MYFIFDVTVLSKYSNKLRKVSKLLVRGIVLWYNGTGLYVTA